MKFGWIIGTVVLLLSSGCGSLEAVRDYSGSVQTTVQNVKPVARDFYDSCKRTQRYRTFSPDDMTYREKPLTLSDDEDADLANACEKEWAASKAIGNLATVLEEYAAALGALAADNLAEHDAELNTVADELKGTEIKGLDDQKIQSVSSLATKVSNAVVGRYQKRQVKKFIHESHPSVVSVSNALADVLEANYLFALDIESAARTRTLKKAALMAEEENLLGFVSYVHQEMENQEEFWEKKEAVSELIPRVRKIGETHAELKESSSELDGEKVQALAAGFKKTVIPVVKKVQEAF